LAEDAPEPAADGNDVPDDEALEPAQASLF
jgi:hypothetical protein